MLTLQEIELLNKALDTYEATNKRAKNNAKQPEFEPIYTKILGDCAQVRSKLETLKPKK